MTNVPKPKFEAGDIISSHEIRSYRLILRIRRGDCMSPIYDYYDLLDNDTNWTYADWVDLGYVKVA